MYNVPPKFNQICRLCLTVVEPKGTSLIDNGEIVKKLSIFHNKNKADKQNNQFNDDVRDDDQLNKKIKRSNEISISLSGGSASVINNGFSSSNDINDDSDRDISKRILQCLSIKVSHFTFFLLTQFQPAFDERKCLSVKHMATTGNCGSKRREKKDRRTSSAFLSDSRFSAWPLITRDTKL